MKYEGLNIGYALTGSHCTIPQILKIISEFVEEGANVTAIISDAVAKTDTRFGKADDIRAFLEEKTGKPVIDSIVKAEPIGPNKPFDVLVIAPCTGNTISKLANGITDTAVLMAAKAHLRNLAPLVIAISTNDGLGLSAPNIARLFQVKNIYFVPFEQDNYTSKPNSIVARLDKIGDTVLKALNKEQNQPLLV